MPTGGVFALALLREVEQASGLEGRLRGWGKAEMH